MKKIAISTTKFICFFMGWAVLAGVLSVPDSSEPAIWRLWAEIIPLLAIVLFTLIFWLAEKKSVTLHLVEKPMRGILLGIVMGLLWLAIPTLLMYITKSIHFDGMNKVKLFSIWMIAAFLNVIMHFLWNGIGALILGGVSLADDYPSLLATSFSGNEILSGGACKIEGSIFVLIVNIVLIVLFVLLNSRKKSNNS